jgi:hypothetical protein
MTNEFGDQKKVESNGIEKYLYKEPSECVLTAFLDEERFGPNRFLLVKRGSNPTLRIRGLESYRVYAGVVGSGIALAHEGEGRYVPTGFEVPVLLGNVRNGWGAYMVSCYVGDIAPILTGPKGYQAQFLLPVAPSDIGLTEADIAEL